MGRDLYQTERDTLESMIDSAGLCAVVQALSEICGEKAEHIRANWQDRDTAKAWDSAGGVLGVASCNRHLLTVGAP